MTSARLQKSRLAILLLIFEVVFIVLFATTTDYEDSARPPASLQVKNGNGSEDVMGSESKPEEQAAYEPGPLATYFPVFQDVHVMIFLGIGFLMTYLRRYGFSSVSFNLLLGAVAIQWAMLVSGYIHGHGGKVYLGITNMLTAEFAAAVVLISMGVLLGKTSPLQLFVMCQLEIVLFAVNEWIGLVKLQVVDVGGTIFVHAFAAYFGLAASRVLYKEEVTKSEKEGSVYHSDLFSMIGTIFLWLFWPSFNSALAVEDGRHRAVINTYLALAACCVVTFAISALTEPKGRFSMVYVQNATLAGGVAVGTTADMMIGTHGALLIGSLAGAVSAIGYKYISPFMASKLKIHDTCGVHNLHGMPAILGTVAGCIASALADIDNYGYTLYRQFPTRVPANASSPEFQMIKAHIEVSPGLGRSASVQAGFQMLALVVTVLIAIVGGVIVGLIVRFVPLDQPQGKALFEDQDNWEVPDDFSNPEAGAPLPVSPSKSDSETTFSKD